MRTILLCVLALCSHVMSMTAQVTGRIEYPYRADYEDQLVLPMVIKDWLFSRLQKIPKQANVILRPSSIQR